MKDINEVKAVTCEMGELLQGADKEQKLLIRGILIGANMRKSISPDENPANELEGVQEAVSVPSRGLHFSNKLSCVD